MRRVLVLAVLAAVSAAGQKTGNKVAGGASAFSKPVFEAYVRHLFVWPLPIQIVVDDPKPGPMPGFSEVDVHASQGNASSTEVFYVSKDGQKIIRGQVFDVAKNPFKSDLDKIKTDFRPSFGTPGAPVVIVEFSDFQCHYCKEEAKAIRENLLKEYPTQVRFYYMDNPLESVHPWARAAADAGMCIFKQAPAKFWDFHDWIFEHQEEITPDNLHAKVLEFGKSKELDELNLTRCMDTKATDADVQKTLDQGKALGVSSTPTTFINGRKMVGAVDWPSMKRVIDFEIEYQKTAKNAGEDCGCEVTLPTPGFAK